MTKRLDKIAPTVLNAFASNPPVWADEFNTWVSNTLGQRPSSITRAAASKQYDAAVLGAVLAFNYLAAGMEDKLDAESTTTDSSDADPAA